MNKSFIGLLTLTAMTQAFAFGIQIDTKKRPNFKSSSDHSIFSTENDEQWVGAVAEGLMLDKYLPKLGSPVHESITLSALKRAGMDNKTSWIKDNDTVYGPDEVLTGLLWNDDPDGFLFPKSKMNPKGFHKHLNGVSWLLKFAKLEYYIYKRNSGEKKKPLLLKQQKQLNKDIKTFKPMSVSSWNVYDSMIFRLNTVNSKLKEIEEIETRFKVGDVKEIKKNEERLIEVNQNLARIQKSITSPDLRLREFKKFQNIGRSRSTDTAGLSKAIQRYVKKQELTAKKLRGEKNKLVRIIRDLKQYSAIEKSIMYASHFGNMQYLHSMGSQKQTRDEVKKKIMAYISHAWKTASGELPYKQQLSTILKVQREFRNSGKHADSFKNRFTSADLLYHTDDEEGLRYRALGSILHLVQDSYAKGHTVRENWEINRGDDNIDMANSGRIRFFQDYSEQGEGEESHADHDTNKENPDNFEDIPGAKMAIKRSATLISHFINKCTWKNEQQSSNCPIGGVEEYVSGTIFSLVPEIEAGKIPLKHDHSQVESSKTRAHPKLVPIQN